MDVHLNDETPITANELEKTLFDIAEKINPWATGKFGFVQKLQEAVRNHGRVDLMHMPTENGNRKVVVKKMPNEWVRAGPVEFQKTHPSSSERPWHDLGFVRMLHQRGSPYVCELLGVFVDEANTYVAMELATEGDLFEWCNSDPRPGVSHAREAVMKPLVIQIFSAVRWIHALGIAHRDLSLENILLTKEENGLRIKIIDFGMGTLKRKCSREIRGKASYQAPEMLEEDEYDSFLTDVFALGVLVMTMAVHDYPWSSVKRNTCQLFEYYRAFGLIKLLKRRKLRKGKGEQLIEVISESLVELLQGLLSVDPRQRLTLGEPCWVQPEGKRRSIWDMAWLHGCSPRHSI
jgi:serine/threonine protein kinase